MSVTETRLKYLARVRLWELEAALDYFPTDGKVLEIGPGNGEQSRKLASLGYKISAVEIERPTLAESDGERVWSGQRASFVQLYDGVNLPFEDNSFDVVYSSNVLEHVPHVETFQKEIQRVLRPDGVAIHLLPSPAWRFWQSLSHVPKALMESFDQSTKDQSQNSSNGVSDAKVQENQYEEPGTRRRFSRVLKRLMPPAHGVTGSAITEIYYFSRTRWRHLFEKTGWQIQGIYPTHLFNTGLLNLLGIPGQSTSRILSYPLGSACYIYVLRMCHSGQCERAKP